MKSNRKTSMEMSKIMDKFYLQLSRGNHRKQSFQTWTERKFISQMIRRPSHPRKGRVLIQDNKI